MISYKTAGTMSRDQRKAGPHHSVVNLRVTGGFLGGATLEFADGLNCLIGGRGTGKTTALEFLRFGLGLIPDPKVNQQRHKAIEGLVKANLGGGRIAIQLRTKTGMRYAAERSASDPVQVVNEAGTSVAVSLERDQIFGADVFSQNEIEEIAANPAAQLSLLDRFVENETSAIARELEQLKRLVDQTSVDLRRLDTDIEDLGARASELPILEERLKGFAQASGPDASKINAAHATKTVRDREARVPEQLTLAVQRATSETAAIATAFQSTMEAQLDASVRSGTNADLFATLEMDLRGFERALLAGVDSMSKAAAAADAALLRHRSAIAERHAQQEAEYRKVVSEFEEEGGRAAEHATLQRNHAEASDAAKLRDALEIQRKTIVAKRAELLARISEARDRRYAARRRVAERLTHQFPTIRVTITQAADSSRYRELVAMTLKGQSLRQNVLAERLTDAFLPTELARAVVTNDVTLVAERMSIEIDRARRIVDALRANGGAYELEVMDLEDVPCIELLDGDTYKESPNLSTGQRCTTILPILLVQNERPLLIDQPEDNLDNAFIYETIVKALHAVKGVRQVIFVTHNPNIPVLGEAERVFVLDSDGQKARVRRVGSVDECKDDIETILEGGREAFLQRKKRYGH